jgi:hypothetical protein
MRPNRQQVTKAQVEGGTTARHVLLAYAFHRGYPYRAVEVSNRKDHKPDLFMLGVASGFLPLDPAKWSELDKETIEIKLTPLKAWLDAPVPPKVAEQAFINREAQLAAKAFRRHEYLREHPEHA